MEAFLKKIVDWNKFELTIDTKIFSKDLVLKTSYNFLDLWYFYFKMSWNNIVLQLTKKSWDKRDLEDIIWDFSSSLLETYLRDKLERDNKSIREAIVEKAINGPLDANNFVSLDTDKWQEAWEQTQQNQIDFDKDIDEILKEIENDPELKIDEEEIEKILKEIEEESESEASAKPSIKIDPNAVKNAKKNFKK